MVRSQWQEVPPRYACTLNTFDTRDYGYLNAIRVWAYLGRSNWKARASWVQTLVKAAGKKNINTVFWP